MDDHLQRLKRELRSEKCPPHVLGRVREQIALERSSRTTGFRLPVFASVAVILILVVLAIFQLSKSPHLSSQEAHVATIDAAQVAEETRLSLACIGHVLLEASRYSEAVILKEALPPLRSGFWTLQATVKSQKEL